MTTEQKSTEPIDRCNDTAAITAAMRKGVRAALISHKQTGDPICVWEDGKVVWIPADEIVIPDDAED
jgi:predicted metal-dependent phosphotriesterase family hydrolase